MLVHRIGDWSELTQSREMGKEALKMIDSITGVSFLLPVLGPSYYQFTIRRVEMLINKKSFFPICLTLPVKEKQCLLV